jgi:hypothetical protein
VKLRGIFSTVIAIVIGILVLLGYFVDIPFLIVIRQTLLQWGLTLAGVAVLLGIGNLVSVHLKKIREREANSMYSVVLMVFMLITIALGLTMGVQSVPVQFIFTAIQIPIETSLTALLAITLLYASIRLLRWRTDLMSIVFVITAIILFIGLAPLPFVGHLPVVSDYLRPYISQVLAAGGARGILIGIALGALTTGLRILMGFDRPYGGSK